MSQFSELSYLVIDVDGTLTDAGIYYDEHGNELKKFCTKDAAGFFAAKAIGIKTVVLTGRECAATARRMSDLKVDHIFQNVKDKQSFLLSFMEDNQLSKEQLGYIGDDLNDLLPMQLAGFMACPADSCEEIKRIADYVSTVNGGHGAVREIIEHALRASGDWDSLVEKIYGGV
jgi:3-deoxy-D-manno-octulosonate 8-phosphate phosphatase (KDO 8-P phosphatase)